MEFHWPVVDCGSAVRYNWGSSLFPNDCDLGAAINAPCTGIPGNDGDAKYLAFQQVRCNGQPAPPACVTASGLWVTNLRFRAIGATNGVAGPAQIFIDSCVRQTRTLVASGSSTGEDITGSLGPPAQVVIECLSDSDCPLGACDNGECLDCLPPMVETAGPRYLYVTPQTGPPQVALFVSGVGPDVACKSGYVHSDGVLGPDPEFLPPATWGTVAARSADMISGKTYDVRTDCDPGNPGANLSEPTTATLWDFGDVDNDADTSILDAVRILDGFRGNFHTIPCTTNVDCMAPTPVPPYFQCDQAAGRCLFTKFENVDLMGDLACLPNRDVSILDVMYSLDAFKGRPDPCDIPCP